MSIASISNFIGYKSEAKPDASESLVEVLKKNDTETLVRLVREGTLVSVPLPNGEMPLHYAIRSGAHECAKIILEDPRVDPEGKDHQGLSPMDHASIANDPKMCALLLGHQLGVFLDADLLKMEKNPSLIAKLKALLKSFLTNLSKRVSSLPSIHRLAFDGDFQGLRKALQGSGGVGLDVADEHGMTPLHYAVVNGRAEIANWLLSKRCNPNLITKDGKTLIHLAAISKDIETLDTCLKYGKTPLNAIDNEGLTALHYGVLGNFHSSMKALTQKGANPSLSGNAVSVLSIMLEQAKEQAENKDPLKLSLMQKLAFASTVLAWVAYAAGESLITSAAFIPNFLLHCGLVCSQNSIQAKLAVMILPFILPLSGDYGGRLFNAWTGYHVLKNAYSGLVNCLNNRNLETYRPIRNAVIHSAAASNVIAEFWSSIREYTSIREYIGYESDALNVRTRKEQIEQQLKQQKIKNTNLHLLKSQKESDSTQDMPEAIIQFLQQHESDVPGTKSIPSHKWKLLGRGISKNAYVHEDLSDLVFKIPKHSEISTMSHFLNLQEARNLVRREGYKHIVIPQSYLVKPSEGRPYLIEEKLSVVPYVYIPEDLLKDKAKAEFWGFIAKSKLCDFQLETNHNAQFIQSRTPKIGVFDFDCRDEHI